MATATDAPTKTRRGRKPAATNTESTPAPAAPKRVVSDDHKAAMARGRRESLAVSAYLDALEVLAAARPKGRQRSPEAIRAKIEEINLTLGDAATKPLQRLQLIQDRLDLESQLEKRSPTADLDMEKLTADFVEVAASYSQSKGIGVPAWRAVGVPADVLRKAGVTRAS